MNNKNYLFIPDKLKVGYKKSHPNEIEGRNIAYFIYWDEKNKLRKETSWESWRDKSIEPDEIENKPLDGFRILHVRRGYYWSGFDHRDSKIIIQHPTLGCVFEITPCNLLEIIMAPDGNGVNNKGIIQSPCVMAWNGTELVLMSTKCPEYESSFKHSKEIKKVNKIVPEVGHSYYERNGNVITYLGRLVTYNIVRSRYEKDGYHLVKGEFLRDDEYVKINKEKSYMFLANNDWRHIFTKSNLSSIVGECSDQPVVEEKKCTELIEEYKQKYTYVTNPYMPWEYKVIPVTAAEIRERFIKDKEDFPYEKNASARFYTRTGKSGSYGRSRIHITQRTDEKFEYHDGWRERKFSTLDDLLKNIEPNLYPHKLGFYSYLKPDEIIYYEYY